MSCDSRSTGGLRANSIESLSQTNDFYSLMNANDMMTVTGSLDSGHINLGMVGARPRPSVPFIPELPPLYAPSPIQRPDREAAKLVANIQSGPDLKRKRVQNGEEEEDRDTLFEGHGTLSKKQKRGNKGGETAGAAGASGPAETDSGANSPSKPAGESPSKLKDRDPSTMSARDLKKLQRKKGGKDKGKETPE